MTDPAGPIGCAWLGSRMLRNRSNHRDPAKALPWLLGVLVGLRQGKPRPRVQDLVDLFVILRATIKVCSSAIADLDVPLLRSKADWDDAALPAGIAEAQRRLAWAEHLVIIDPLWLAEMTALLKGSLEQVLRPASTMGGTGTGSRWTSALNGTSSRLVITTGMPAFAYRWHFGAHSLKSLKRSILSLVGIGPNRQTLSGMFESPSPCPASARALDNVSLAVKAEEGSHRIPSM